MESVRRVTNAISRTLQKVEMLIGCVCLALMLGLMLFNAIARYLFDFPVVWSDEMNNFFFVWLGFMACAYIMGQDSHMAVTGLVGMLPRRARYVIKTCMNVVMIVVLLCYIPGFITLMGRVTLSGLLRLPLKYVYSILPISFGLMSFHVLNNIVNDTCEEMAARGKKEG
ncbi:MAG TPA: TRAP transporter small permease [Candidatus Ventricola gallistercoris]|nr:TRAP transporter small permease [Candidatus Ventricola gallistercoris]